METLTLNKKPTISGIDSTLSKRLADKEMADYAIEGRRALDEKKIALPQTFNDMPPHLVHFLITSYPSGLPKEQNDALKSFVPPVLSSVALTQMAHEFSEYVSNKVGEKLDQYASRDDKPFSNDEKQMIDAAFPNGLGIYEKLPPGALLKEARGRLDYPNLGDLNANTREFIAAKMPGGWSSEKSPEQLAADAKRIHELQSSLSLFGGAGDAAAKNEILRLGGDPDPNSDLRFGLKALLGVTAIAFAVANPLLAIGGAAVAHLANRTGGKVGG